MQRSQIKHWLLFIGSTFFAIFFVWFGFLLFSLSAKPVTTTQLFLLGCASVLASLFVMSNVKRYNLPAASLLLAVGIYYFARSAGIITNSLLVRLLGLASWAAAVLLLYITYPNRKSLKSDHNVSPNSDGLL